MQTLVPEVLWFRCCLRPYCSQVLVAAACSGFSSCLFDKQETASRFLQNIHTCEHHGGTTPEGPENKQCCKLQGDQKDFAYPVSVLRRPDSSSRA